MNEATSYTLRDLTAKDIFPMSKIISKIGLKEFVGSFQGDEIAELVKAATVENKQQAAAKVGIGVALNMANIIFENLPSVEQDIYRFLSSLSGYTVKEIAELPMNTFAEMVVDVISKPEFSGFIKVVSKLFKSEN